jgi:hypothetical protein
MRGPRVEARWAAWLPVLVLWSCSSAPPPSARDVADANDTGGTLHPKNETDRELLKELPSLPSGTPQRVAGASVVADAPYTSASGRSCRAMHVTTQRAGRATPRLACTDGKAWFFVPDVFGNSSSE